RHGDFETVVAGVNQRTHAVDRFANDLAEVDLFQCEADAPAGDAGDVEQIVEQAHHVRDLSIHDIVGAPHHGIVAAAAPQYRECRPNGGERVAQFVTEHGE